MFKKYIVRIYNNSFYDVEIEALNESEAIEKAYNSEIDVRQLLDNLVQTGEESVEEVGRDLYSMKLALEADGWDWNVLDMMDDEEIEENFRNLESF